MMPGAKRHDIAIIGAGPIGLELAVNLKAAGADYVQIDANQVGHTISWYPRQATFFSSPDRIAICGVPFHTPDQAKATGEQYLAYLRGIVEQFDLSINTYQRVTAIHRDGDGFVLDVEDALCTGGGANQTSYHVKHVVLAIGDMHHPRKLGIPGEDAPNVSHYFDEPHRYFRKKLLIVGGRNSAVEAAIRCHRAGAAVSLSYRGKEFDEQAVKYWLKPEIQWLIKTGAITYYPNTLPTRIDANGAELQVVGDHALTADPATAANRKIDADFVLLLTGYEMDTTLLETAGVELHGPNRGPRIDHATLQTNVPNLYVAGTAVAGTQNRFKLFIENSHPHVVKIMRAITGQDPRHVNALAWRRLDENPLQEHDGAES